MPLSAQNDVPFELHLSGGGGFITFDIGEFVALPLLTLAKATLRGTGGHEIVLEFSDCSVAIEGHGLAEVFEHLLAARVKTIRPGHQSGCTIERLRLTDL